MKVTDKQIRSRLFAQAELCEGAIDIAGLRLQPDATKAYVAFKIAHGFTKSNRAVTAYGTAFHPATVARCHQSLQHQVLSWGHKIKSYNSKDKDEKPESRRDYVLGSIVAVEHPSSPLGGWTVDINAAPHIRAAAVIHKQLEKVPQTLGEHLGGRHTWTVSLEADYSLLDSGFIIGDRANAKKKVEALLAETTPREFTDIGMGYVTIEQAPDALLDTFDWEKGVVNKTWEGLPVVLLKGGLSGEVHFKGVGLVRYGAERQAEIQQILASDPNALDDGEVDLTGLRAYFSHVAALARAFPEF